MQRTGEEGGKERMEEENENGTGGGKKPHQWGWENGANQVFAFQVLLRRTVSHSRHRAVDGS
jgi:hypothetical protein